MGCKEEKEGVNLGGKRETLWHDNILHSALEKIKRNREEREMNDEQKSHVPNAEALMYFPVRVRTTRGCSRREKLPLLASYCPK